MKKNEELIPTANQINLVKELLPHLISHDSRYTFHKIFTIEQISKVNAYTFVSKYHYLHDAIFFNQYSYGLFYKGILIGVASYAQPQGAMTIKGWFGDQFKGRTNQVMELQRLAMLPCLNGTNATSYLLGRSMKLLKQYHVKVVITLADASRHVRSIYQVCNFKYYGLTNPKTDFYREDTGLKNGHAKTKNVLGCSINRTRKHRYCFKLDRRVHIKYAQVDILPSKGKQIKPICYEGTGVVYDHRFKRWYTCPIHTGKLRLLNYMGSGVDKFVGDRGFTKVN